MGALGERAARSSEPAARSEVLSCAFIRRPGRGRDIRHKGRSGVRGGNSWARRKRHRRRRRRSLRRRGRGPSPDPSDDGNEGAGETGKACALVAPTSEVEARAPATSRALMVFPTKEEVVLRAKEEVVVIVVTPRLEAVSSALHPWAPRLGERFKFFLKNFFGRSPPAAPLEPERGNERAAQDPSPRPDSHRPSPAPECS